jgi:splicing factor 45
VVGGAVGAAAAVGPGTSSPDKQLSSSTPQQPSVGRGLTFEEFTNKVDEDEDEELYVNRKPKWQGRGGKKHKNKKNKKFEEEDEMDWDAIYDPARPSNLAKYQGSTEQDAERAEWTHFVHWHRDTAAKHTKVQKTKPRNSRSTLRHDPAITDRCLDMFAPPAGLNFAPPVINDAPPVGNDAMDINDDEYYPPPASAFSSNFGNGAAPQVLAPSVVPDDPTGDDAYMRRLRLSGMAQQADPRGSSAFASQQTPPVGNPSRPAVPSSVATPPTNLAAQMEAAKAKLAATKAKIEAATKAKVEAQRAQIEKPAGPSPTPPAELAALPQPPPVMLPQDTSTIAKAPVLYNLAEAQVDALVDHQMGNAQSGQMTGPHSTAPVQQTSKVSGQKGFAARLMAKMGWEEGQGLGAKGEGITTAIIAQATKRKRRSDKDGGGWMPSTGKIVGGKKRKMQSTADDEGEFGNISNVVKLQGMLDELDVTYEIEEKNLLQEIGEQFSKDYGPIERLFIWREQNGGKNEVFVKFTNQLSALNACGGTNEMTFAGNPVKARFFDAVKFENGEYV